MRVFSVVSLWFALAMSASAVCLNGHPAVQKEYDLSYAVFIGTVTGQQHVPAPSPLEPDGTTYVLKVDEVLRGKVEANVSVFSENSTGRFPMRVGTQYLLFVNREGERTVVDNCGNSEALKANSPTLAVVRRLKGGNAL
jgi:hypothetical protein